jgi:hypothetical protein
MSQALRPGLQHILNVTNHQTVTMEEVCTVQQWPSKFFLQRSGYKQNAYTYSGAGVVDDDIQITTTLIILVLQLVHHFIEGTDIDTTDVNTTTILVLLVLVLSNCSTPCLTA